MEIPLKISYRGLKPSPALDDQIREWAARLDRLHDRIQHCDVVVEAPHRHHRQGQQFHVRVTLGLPGGQLVVSHDPGPDEAHEDAYVAVRDTFHALRRQLEDHVRHHLRRDIKAHEEPEHGRVTYLDAEGEWGFIDTADARRLYFHRNSVLGGIEKLALGDEVRFAEEAGEQGPQATTVSPVGHHGHHEVPAVEKPS